MKIIKLLSECLPILFWILAVFGFEKGNTAVYTVISALIHEIGHISVLLLLKKKAALPKGHLSGFRILVEGLSYRDDLAVSLSGPLFNVILFVLCFLFECNRELGYISLITALSNLLPVKGYDGYRALYALISLLSLKADKLLRLLSALSFFTVCVFLFLSLYLLLRAGEGYWIYGVFLYSLIEIMKNDEYD